MSETVGQLLRATREAKGQTLEDVERVTRIRARHLAALEAGEITALPSAAHARGFLKNYAQHLGLDPAEVLSRFEASQQKRSLLPRRPPPKPPVITQAPSRPRAPPRVVRAAGSNGAAVEARAATAAAPRVAPAPPPSRPGRVRRRRLLSVDGVVAVVVTAMLAGLLFWGGSRLASGAAATATAVGLTSTARLAGTAAAAGTPLAATATVPVEATLTVDLPTPAAVYTGVNLVVRAEQRTWVGVRVDGVEVFAGLMPPGESREFAGQGVIEVSTGNGKATRVMFNGVDQGNLGDQGEAVIRLWTLNGALTPTPTVAPTETPGVSLREHGKSQV